MTIRRLLTHTSGLTINGDGLWAAWNANAEAAAINTATTTMAKALAALPLQSQPGERFDYGPTGACYQMLGAVI